MGLTIRNVRAPAASEFVRCRFQIFSLIENPPQKVWLKAHKGKEREVSSSKRVWSCLPRLGSWEQGLNWSAPVWLVIVKPVENCCKFKIWIRRHWKPVTGTINGKPADMKLMKKGSKLKFFYFFWHSFFHFCAGHIFDMTTTRMTIKQKKHIHEVS
jgi:hypothetical protein